MRLIDADALMRKFKTVSPMAIDGRARQMVEEMPTIEQWIPCSERLPEEDTYVLATTAWGEITMAEKLSDIAWFIYEGTANAKSDDIVAWMPLPEPYAERREE